MTATGTAQTPEPSIAAYTPYQSQYLAHLLTLEGNIEDTISRTIKSARVDMNPHQVEAALFALHSPVSKGVLLADEVGLGKTIEAALVISEYWAQRKRHILLIAPASLRKQWNQELLEKFSLPSVVLDAGRFNAEKKAGRIAPFDRTDAIVITSYEFAARKADDLKSIKWDLIVFDEAHKLRNVYKKDGAQRARTLRETFLDKNKILLTATPLQNSLMELYGLVSVIDQHFFGSEDAFKVQYVGARSGRQNFPVLKKRLEMICKRTLRKQVQEAGLIPFTNRYPLTEDFTPSNEEQRLYDEVSAYLQRTDTKAIGENGRHLVALVIRKILASSSIAIAETLRRMVDRLERSLAVDVSTVDDYEALDDTVDELEIDTDDHDVSVDKEKLTKEIQDLKDMQALAMAIKNNAKADALLKTLPAALGEVEKRGGQRKAVIFTESRRTQDYLKTLLTEQGYDGQIVMMNGSNSDPDSQAIYRAWLEKHKGTEIATGSKTADMKQAVVEAFRDNATILLATESGAEGINLQFCSLVINYDLPWNPQRVEQRIGRCHRYGQKQDVCVVNFVNTRNRADQRVYQLLAEKFHLFEGVFGASDEVLGEIERGVDIEQRIFSIYQNCRTEADIEQAFDELQAKKRDEIEQMDEQARRALLASVDSSVVDKLRWRNEDTASRLSAYEESLMRFTRAELPDAEFLNTKRFVYQGETYSIEWPEADEHGWHFYRIKEGEFAEELLNRAKVRKLPPVTLRFSYEGFDGNGQLSDLRPLRGKAGWLNVTKLTLGSEVTRTEHLVLTALTDDGQALETESCSRLLNLPANQGSGSLDGIPTAELEEIQARLVAARTTEAEVQNRQLFEEESEKLEAWADDVIESYEAEIRTMGKEIRQAQKAVRTCATLDEKVQQQRHVKKLQGDRRKLSMEFYEKQEEIEREQQSLLDRIEASLRLTPQLEPLFIIRWELH
ncbi:MAG: DEAD/DEAH box helicase family protein [Vampirovibrionales bacterium]|nr:DEAD/DEAH box helicase family protein [Vampirovibrionales bacterium]